MSLHAIILAAGEGSRMRPLTEDRPKCLVEFCGKPLLEWQLEALRANGIEHITLVGGYRADQLEPYGPVIVNEAFAETNMVASLMCAAPLLSAGDPVLIVYGDIIFQPDIIARIAAAPAPFSTTVDRRWQDLWAARQEDPLEDAETLRMHDRVIYELGKPLKQLEDAEAQYMGLIKVSPQMGEQMVSSYQGYPAERKFDGRSKERMFMTSFLQALIDEAHSLHAVEVDGGWLEFDSVADFELYESWAASGKLTEFIELG